MTVEVLGQQWSWTFNHGVGEQDPSATAEDGDFAYGSYVYTSGTGADIPTLVIPVDQTIQFNLHSPDVIHNFGVPVFLMRMDVIPGRVNTFQVDTTRIGDFTGKCYEFCGVDHDRMNFQVRVVPPEQFDLFVRDSAAFYEQFAPDPRVVPGNQPFGTTAEAAGEHDSSTEHKHVTTAASAGSPS